MICTEDILCDYGCGQKANYTFGNGKHCCSSMSAKCPAVKQKVRNTVHKNIDTWQKNGQTYRNHSIDTTNRRRLKPKIDNHGKCDNPGCTNYNDGSYGSGRFCSEHCAYAYAVNITKDSKKRKQHYRKLHKIIRDKRQNVEWKCKLCNNTYDTRKELMNHIHKDHFHIKEHNHNQCPFCGKKFDKFQSLGGHIINCKENPVKEFYDDAHKRAGYTFSKKYCDNITSVGTIKTKARHSRYSYFQNIKGETYLLQSSYELNVAKRLNEDGIYWENSTRLKYEINGKIKAYRPDMTIPSLNCYLEVKGWFSEDDQYKMKCILKSNPDAKIYFLYNDSYLKFINRQINLSDDLLITYGNFNKWIK